LQLGAQISQVYPFLSHFPSGHEQFEGDLVTSLQVTHSSPEVIQVPHLRLQNSQVNPSTSYCPWGHKQLGKSLEGWLHNVQSLAFEHSAQVLWH